MHGHARGIHHPRLYDLLIHLATGGRERRYRDQLADLAGVKPGQRVLDIGCGTGTTAIAAANRVQPGGEVYGVDVAPAMVAAARRKAAPGVAVHFQACDLTALPFDGAMFDVALMVTVLHMVPDGERATALREAGRVLKPGGRLLVVDYGGSERRGLLARHRMHRRFDLDTIRPLLEQAGLRQAETGSLGWLSLRYLIAQRS